MKILLISDLYPLEFDRSIPTVLEDFSLSLKKFGNDITVIRPNLLINTFLRKHKIIKEGIYIKKGIKIYNKNFFLPFLNDDILFLKEKYDLIISHMPSGHLYSSLINKKLKLPHIAIVHQSDYTISNDFKYKFYFKKRLLNSLQKATIIGARNIFLKDKFNADFLLPSFIDKKNILDVKKISQEKLKIITLSKLIKRKNIDLIIETLKDFKGNFSFEIYGEGREEKKLKKLIKKYNLEDKIKINKHINHNLIWEKLDKNDIFILPSINETFGLSYLEALSRGLIVVGTKNTGIDGIIENNKNGYLINPNKKELLEVLYKIKNNSQDEIIKNALKTIKEYTEEKIISKYLEIIKKIYDNKYF